MHRHLVLWLSSLGLTILWSCTAAAAEFVDVSELPTDGYSIENPGSMRISGDGTTLVGQRLQPDGFSVETFRWSEANGEMGLGFFDSVMHISPSDVSTDGAYIVGSNGQPIAFRWSEAEGMIGMGSVLDVADGHS